MIELLVVATIIILLTTLGVVSYRQASISSRNAKRKADLETVRQALVLRRSDAGSYPSGTFSVVVGTLVDEGYLSDGIDRFTDPLSDRSYSYAVGGGGTTFTLTAALEPGTTTYVLRNP